MNFLKTIIRQYYSKKPLEEPSDIHKREIALESLEDGKYIRHLSFPYMSQLYDYILRVKTPLHLYYSSALYASPSSDKMEDKEWEGSELIFDIDADKYPGCEQVLWICPSNAGISISKLDSCPGGEKPVEYSTLSWSCIKRAWVDIIELVKILKEELGYKKIKIYFSGNRGFHVRVYDSDVLSLSRESRKAIADYVSCDNLSIQTVFPDYRGKVLFIPPEFGIRRRVYEYASKMGIIQPARLRGLRDIYALDTENLSNILSNICIKVDKAVTMDTSRLSRFGNSLNMKAGLKVVEIGLNVNIDELYYDKFSPFKGYVKIKSLITGNIQVLDNQVELSRYSVSRVDGYIGVYLVVKNIAVPVDYSELEVKP
ncbi:MAG: DNA primase small subunit domain-containing protein [Desulfurococcaceae archaeon]